MKCTSVKVGQVSRSLTPRHAVSLAVEPKTPVVAFIIADKARAARGVEVRRCQCYERQS